MMKKIYLLLAMLAAFAGSQAQSSFSDDFESYTLGAYVAQASPNWTTWSNAPGGPEDAQVVNTNASSGTQSIYFNSTAASGGPQDLVLPFGGQHTTGTFTYEMDMLVSSNKGAYFNFQGDVTIGTIWVLDAYFLQTGSFFITASGATVVSGTYPTNTWFNIRVDINLNTNTWEVFPDNVSQGVFSNPNNQIASIDLYPVNQTGNGGNGQSEFWVDDVSYTHTPYTLPTLNAGVVGSGVLNPATGTPGGLIGYVGQNRYVAGMVRNLGLDPITSFDLSFTYNSITQSTSVTGVNIPSLGTYVVEFANPAALIFGTNPMIVAVSNVNGLGADGDIADDTISRDVTINIIPSANKKVLIEEGTGTWCQWCPRGAVYMDYMAESYPDVFAGVAVHNGDPMTIPSYDTPFSAMLTGYPGIVTDRMSLADPLDIEAELLARLTVDPHAFITNGAMWDSLNNTLEVSLTFDFQLPADSLWRVACVLIEDSVTGTNGYAQYNAYGNNANGPMGGYELLGTLVPAAQMHYNHVARAISPNFLGAFGLPGSINVGQQAVFNFSFNIPADWDHNQLHIVGMLINSSDEVNNASNGSLAAAIANGFTSGTPVVGISAPVQPDAEVVLYPNPSKGSSYLNFNLQADTDVEVSISDMTGKVLATQKHGVLNGGHVLPINTQQLAKGIYLVDVRLNGVSQVKRLVVE